MPWFLHLIQSLGSAGATSNARAELEIAQHRRVQAAVVARRIGTIDAVAGRRDTSWPSTAVGRAA